MEKEDPGPADLLRRRNSWTMVNAKGTEQIANITIAVSRGSGKSAVLLSKSRTPLTARPPKNTAVTARFHQAGPMTGPWSSREIALASSNMLIGAARRFYSVLAIPPVHAEVEASVSWGRSGNPT